MPKVNSKNYYEILGVEKNADEKTIKKSYRKLAMKWHPDRNKDNNEEATQKFQEINQAFAVLSDDKKRKLYDQFGEEGVQQGGDMPDMNPFDIFGSFFGDNNPFGGMFSGMSGMGGMGGRRERDNSHEKTPDKKLSLEVPIKVAFCGGKISKSMTRREKCPNCRGLGCENSSDIVKCFSCDGKGQTVQVQRVGPMITQSVQACNTCHGKGKQIKKGKECKKCKGSKIISNIRNYNITIPAGTIDNDLIKMPSESDWVEGYGDYGDLYFHIKLNNNGTHYKREGQNLIINKEISLIDSLCGVHFGITHLDDRIIEVEFNDILKYNNVLVIKGEGMPANGRNKKGDLIIRFKIIYPSKFIEQQKEYLRKLIPNNTNLGPANMNIQPEKLQAMREENQNSVTSTNPIKERLDLDMPDFDNHQGNQQSRNHSGRSGFFEHMGGIPGMGGMNDPNGGQGVECATQ